MHEWKESINKFFPITLGILLVLFDQLTKYEIREQGGFYICNENLAFGLPASNFPLLLLVFIVLLVVFNFKSISNSKFKISNFDTITLSSALLILSGAISNIIDRLHFGCVTDFIDLGFWPVFNFADIYISIGVAIIMAGFLFKKDGL